ncbi:MAG: Maf family protein [Treponema sp.]|nr:Maf family protein [Treponema sp.]
MEPIILASSSPRRQEIFKQLNIPFQVKLSPEEEIIPEDMEKEKVPEYLAINKVKSVEKAYFADREIPWIFGADTMVYLDGELLGKPADSGEAAKYLERIQGRTHKVITGMALFNGKLMYVSSRTVVTEVTFAPMTKEEIDWYVESGEWHGAAGGYRIQGLASCFISKIVGTSTNVVGLPIFDLYDMLKEQGYSFIE